MGKTKKYKEWNDKLRFKITLYWSTVVNTAFSWIWDNYHKSYMQTEESPLLQKIQNETEN